MDAQAGKLGRKVSDESGKLKMVKMVQKALEPRMQELEKEFLSQDDQEHCVENLHITSDDPNRNKILEGFTENSDKLWSKTPGIMEGSLSGEGTSTGLSPFVEIVNAGGFRVLKENSPIIQEIFSQCPNIASGFQVRRLATKNGFINTLAEVYKMAKQEQHTLEEIKDMEDGIADLELAGLNIPWLKTLVAKCREEVEVNEKIKKKEVELKLLKEMQSKIAEDSKPIRQRIAQELFSTLGREKELSGNSDTLGSWEKMQPRKSNRASQLIDSFPSFIQQYVVDIIDVKSDGHCGFRAIAALLGFGEDDWSQVRKDLITELSNFRSFYDSFYGSDAIVAELLDALSCFIIPAPCKNWMTLPDMGHLVATRYNVVLVHISKKQCFTYLPLRSSPPSLLQHREIVIGFVDNNHFVQVSMHPNSPIPPIVPNWRSFRHECAVGWEALYLRRIEAFDSIIPKHYAIVSPEIINLVEP
ncbi:hypothetical protein PTKIN_Ptkin12aG0015800 [Pterospermum kingtungense]